MSPAFRWSFAAVIGFASLAASGCALPVSDHPLSDDKTSVIDERLIGYWMYVPKDKDENQPPAPYVIGRVPDKSNTLEVVYTELDSDGYVKVIRLPVYTTTLDERHYLSLTFQSGAAQPYLVLLYKFGDDDTLQFYFPRAHVIAAAIEQGRLPGVVERHKPQPGEETPSGEECAKPVEPRYKSIRITATPKELAAFLKENGTACYKVDQPATLKRIPAE